MGRKKDWLQFRVAALDGVKQTKSVDGFELGALVTSCWAVSNFYIHTVSWAITWGYSHGWIRLAQRIMQIKERKPAVILVEGAKIIVADTVYLDNGRVSLDLSDECLLGREELVGGRQAI